MGNRKLWLVVVVLLVPVLPFLLMGYWFEPLVEKWFVDFQSGQANLWSGAAIILGLTLDILLPIPSSVLLTCAGRLFGGWGGAVVGWAGLNLSAAVGIWISRKIGPKVVQRFSSEQDVADFQLLDSKIGWWSLVACRPLPILAEASVIFAGLSQMPLNRFWPPVLFANAIVALLYGGVGDFAARQQWFGAAVLASMVCPLLFIGGWRCRQYWRRKQRVTQAEDRH